MPEPIAAGAGVASSKNDADEVLPASTADIAEAGPREMPLPRNYQSLMLSGIFGLMLLSALYLARDIAMPIVFAFVLNLALRPAMRALGSLRVPQPVAGLILLAGFLVLVAGLGATVSAPAAE